jgi:uncharacterized protein YecT (DUF1311 family)
MRSIFALSLVTVLLGACSNEAPEASKANEATAQQREPLAPSSDFDSCMDNMDLGAFKNSQWLACHEAELRRVDSILNENYSFLKQHILNRDVQAKLVEGQRAWVGFRDRYCEFEGRLNVAPTPEIGRVSCLIDLTRAQATRLKEAQ